MEIFIAVEVLVLCSWCVVAMSMGSNGDAPEDSQGAEPIRGYLDRLKDEFEDVRYKFGDDMPQGMERECERRASAGRHW